MMELNGKTYYRIGDAEKEFGYTRGTLVDYISGGIIDADRMEDGEWLITETGWVQLRRRKKAGQHETAPRQVTMDAPPNYPPPSQEMKPPDHIADANKSISKDSKTYSEGSLYIRTEKQMEAWQTIKTVAGRLGIPVGDLTMQIICSHVEKKIQPKMAELQKLKEQEKALLSGMI